MRQRPYLFFAPLLLITQFLAAQAGGFFSTKVDVHAYKGALVTLEAAVRVDRADKSTGAALLLSEQKTDRKGGGIAYSKDPITAGSWARYTLSLQLGPDADSLGLGGYVRGEGVFWFDAFSITINGERLVPDNAGFEAELAHWKTNGLPRAFSAEAVTAGAYAGSRCLVIDGSGGKTLYGANLKAGQWAYANGARIYYETYGSGAPLLLLHGNQGSIGVFAAQIAELSKSYQVIAVDTRGQGRSSVDSARYSYDLFADDIYALLQHLRLDSVYVVGWSDGGNTGLILAMKHPEKVKKLVTMGACVFIDNTVVSGKTLREVEKIAAYLEKQPSEADRNRGRLFRLLLTEPRHSFDDLKSIQCPVLVMAGEDDIILRGHTEGIARNIPKGKLLIVEKEKHELPVDNPALFNKLVLAFLQEG